MGLKIRVPRKIHADKQARGWLEQTWPIISSKVPSDDGASRTRALHHRLIKEGIEHTEQAVLRALVSAASQRLERREREGSRSDRRAWRRAEAKITAADVSKVRDHLERGDFEIDKRLSVIRLDGVTLKKFNLRSDANGHLEARGDSDPDNLMEPSPPPSDQASPEFEPERGRDAANSFEYHLGSPQSDAGGGQGSHHSDADDFPRLRSPSLPTLPWDHDNGFAVGGVDMPYLALEDPLSDAGDEKLEQRKGQDVISRDNALRQPRQEHPRLRRERVFRSPSVASSAGHRTTPEVTVSIPARVTNSSQSASSAPIPHGESSFARYVLPHQHLQNLTQTSTAAMADAGNKTPTLNHDGQRD